MSNQNENISKVKKESPTNWKGRANFRMTNRKWLGYSGKIALRIMSAIEDTPGMNQKKLSELANVTPQQVHKIVKGHENLTLQTIAKFSDILGVELISFPSYKYNETSQMMVNVGANITVFINIFLAKQEVFIIPDGNEVISLFTGNISYGTVNDQMPTILSVNI